MWGKKAHQNLSSAMLTLTCAKGQGLVSVCVCVCVCVFSHVQRCNPMDCSPPAFSVPGIAQARILEWVAISFSRGPGIKTASLTSPALAGGFFTTHVNWEAQGLF